MTDNKQPRIMRY